MGDKRQKKPKIDLNKSDKEQDNNGLTNMKKKEEDMGKNVEDGEYEKIITPIMNGYRITYRKNRHFL